MDIERNTRVTTPDHVPHNGYIKSVNKDSQGRVISYLVKLDRQAVNYLPDSDEIELLPSEVSL